MQTFNELSDKEVLLIRKALRIRMDSMMRTMKHVRGEYSKEYWTEYKELEALYQRMGGDT